MYQFHTASAYLESFFIITYLLSLLTYSIQCRDKPKIHCSVMPEWAKLLQDTVVNCRVISSVNQI